MTVDDRALRAIMAMSGSALILVGADLTIEWVNSTMVALSNEPDLVGTSALEIVHPDDLDNVASVLANHQELPDAARPAGPARLPMGQQLRIRRATKLSDGTVGFEWVVVIGRIDNMLDDPNVGALLVRLDVVADQGGLGRALGSLAGDAPVDLAVAELLAFMTAENEHARIGCVWWDDAGTTIVSEGIAADDLSALTHPSVYRSVLTNGFDESDRCVTLLIDDPNLVSRVPSTVLDVAQEFHLESVTIIPIRRTAGGAPMGVVLYWTPFTYVVRLAPQMAITTATDLLTLALNDRERRTFLEQRAQRDPLTRVLNRSGLDEAAQRMDVFEVIVFDLDAFKPVNDRFGHQTGDQVLQFCNHVVLR